MRKIAEFAGKTTEAVRQNLKGLQESGLIMRQSSPGSADIYSVKLYRG